MHIEDIKKLRVMTNRSILDIKKALEANDGDFELAKADLLSGYHETQTERIASKGSVGIVLNDEKAVIFELTAETDFAIKHPIFIELIGEIKDALMMLPNDDVAQLSKFNISKHTILDHIKIKSAQIHENIHLRRYESLKKDIQQSFSTYEHYDGKNACLLLLNIVHKDLQATLAMQAVAMDALFISQAHLLPSDLEKLKIKYQENPGTYPSFESYLSAKALYEQHYIKNPGQSVKTVLDEMHVKVLAMKRYTLGEGIKDKLICRIDLPKDISKISLSITNKR